MIAFVLSTCLALGVQAPSGSPADSPFGPGPLEVLRELTELGLGARIVADFADDVAVGGPLASDGEAVALVARACFDAGDEARAVALLDGFAGEDRVPVVLMRARLALEADRLDEAWNLVVDPAADADRPRAAREPDAWLLLGRAAHRRGEPERARPLLERALALAPHGPEAPAAWHMLGEAARLRRDVQGARECFAAASRLRRWHELLRVRRLQLRANPSDPLPRFGLAALWLEVDELGRARAEATRLVGDHPEHARGWQLLGEVERRAGATEAALERFARALELDPELPLARSQRGAMLAEAGRFEEAARELDAFLELPEAHDPSYAIAHWHHARALDAVGRRADADAAYTRYRTLGGDRPR